MEEDREWKSCCYTVNKNMIVYICQISLATGVIIASLVNLSSNDKTSDEKLLWSSLLASCLGYILPSPQIREDKKQ